MTIQQADQVVRLYNGYTTGKQPSLALYTKAKNIIKLNEGAKNAIFGTIGR